MLWQTDNSIEPFLFLLYFTGVLYFVSSTVNPILYNLMSKKYRKAFKDTLCKCCMSKEQRNMRDSRGRPIPSGATAYVTVNMSNSSNSRSLLSTHDGAHFHRSPAIRRAFQSGNCNLPNGSAKKPLHSIKLKLFPGSMKSKSAANAIESTRHDENKSKLKTPNGSIGGSDRSRSPSSSPRFAHVRSLREELELNDLQGDSSARSQLPSPKADIITIDKSRGPSEDTML